ncbi:hypothetical protein ESO86_18010, partial [Agromyces binzhouensis]
MRGRTGRTRARVALLAATTTMLACSGALLAGCAPDAGSGPVVIAPSDAPTTTPAVSAPPAVRPAGDVETLASGLEAPWSILRLPDGGVLVSERDR